MALPEIVAADFIGLIKLTADTYTQPQLQAVIDEVYPEFVREILSDAAYIEIRDAVTLPDKWADVMNGNTWLDSDGKQKINTGLSNMVRYWIFLIWQQDHNLVNTSVGNVQNLNENATGATRGDVSALAARRYNKAIGWLHDELYPFLCEYAKVTEAVTNAVDLGGSYQLTVDATTYLEEGETVTVDNIEYTAANVTATTFDIVTSETAFSSASWEPFQDLNMPQKETVFA